MALEEITEEALRDEHPLLIGSCNCSEYSTFIYIGRQDLTEAIKKKMGVDYFDFYNCVKCGTTTTSETIKKNGGY